jgi:signal transduction histidine kinase
MLEFFSQLFSESGFMAHGQCMLWEPEIVGLHVISDFMTGLSYYLIPIALIIFVSKREDTPFPALFWMFGAFILACGTTHFFDIYTMWNPMYRVEGVIKFITGVVSVGTVAMLFPAIPKALTLKSPAELKEINDQLLDEISKRKKSEQKVRSLNQQLQEKIEELERANDELEKFSYSVSHDLRAPLRSIDGFSEALLDLYDDKLDERGQNYLQRVRNSSQEMGTLIDDILELSRISRTNIKRVEFDLSAMVRGISESAKNNHPDRSIEFIIESNMTINADRTLLKTVFQNLIDNAVKFTNAADPAKIEIGTIDKDGETIFYIKDNGVGFDMNYYEKIFTPFQRLHSSRDYEGTGIGMANIQRIIRKHDGRVWAESEPDNGATFYFTIGKGNS